MCRRRAVAPTNPGNTRVSSIRTTPPAIIAAPSDGRAHPEATARDITPSQRDRSTAASIPRTRASRPPAAPKSESTAQRTPACDRSGPSDREEERDRADHYGQRQRPAAAIAKAPSPARRQDQQHRPHQVELLFERRATTDAAAASGQPRDRSSSLPATTRSSTRTRRRPRRDGQGAHSRPRTAGTIQPGRHGQEHGPERGKNAANAASIETAKLKRPSALALRMMPEIRYPEMTKNTSTPTKPPGSRAERRERSRTTPTARARRPSISGR